MSQAVHRAGMSMNARSANGTLGGGPRSAQPNIWTHVASIRVGPTAKAGSRSMQPPTEPARLAPVAAVSMA